MAGVLFTSGVTLRIPVGGLVLPLDGSPPPPVQVEVSLDTWDHWLFIAKERLEDAEEANKQLLESHTLNPAEVDVNAMEQEFRSSMISIASQAIAIDALYACVKERIPRAKHPASPTAGRQKKPARYAHITEMLRRGFKLSNTGTQQVQSFLKQLFERRDWAVHPPGDFRSPIPHPELGVQVEWRFIAFNAKNARVLYDVTDDFIMQLLGSAKPEFDDLKKWADAGRARLDASRGNHDPSEATASSAECESP